MKLQSMRREEKAATVWSLDHARIASCLSFRNLGSVVGKTYPQPEVALV